MTNPHDPVASADAAGRLAADNRAALKSGLGRDPSSAELYLAHQQGVRGALSLISNPNARAVDTIGDLAVTQNGGNRDMTAAQFAQLHSERFNKAGLPAAPAGQADQTSDLPMGVNQHVLAAYPEWASTVKAIDEGRMNIGAVPMKQRAPIEKLLNAYDPDWDQTLWSARNRMYSDLSTNGNAGKMLLAVNQLLPHLKTASDRAEALHNSGFPAANTIKNWWATATGDPRVKTFEEVREVAAMDAARLLRGSGSMAEQDIQFWRNNFSSAGSPKQLQDQIKLLADDLMGARVSSIEHQYRTVMRKEPPQFVSKEAQSALAAIRARNLGDATTGPNPGAADGRAAPSSGAVPTLPSGVPPGSMYSPSRNQFRSPEGKMFDATGKAL